MANGPIENDQKIIYELKPDAVVKRKGELPFVRLLGGEEPIGNVKLRYNLYKRNWVRQMKSIENILNRTDKFIYKSLKNFLCYENQFDERLNTGLVHFGSNIANHARLSKNVSDAITHKDEDQIKKERAEKWLPVPEDIENIVEVDTTICLVHLNSNAHTTMDSVLRAIENEVMKRISQETGLGKGKIRKRRVKRYEYNDDESASSESDLELEPEIKVKEEEEEEDDEEEEDEMLTPIADNIFTSIKKEEDEEEEEENVKEDNEKNEDNNNEMKFKTATKKENVSSIGKRRSVTELRRSRRLKKAKREEVEDDYTHRLARASKFTDLNDLLELLSTVDVRLVVFIENCDSMNLQVVHRLIDFLWKYHKKMKVGLIIGISTPFEIFEEKLPVLLMNLMRTKTFSVDNSSDAINEIMEDLLLNINDTYNSLIFDPQLVLDFLKRRDEISILQFYNYMKAIYMNHYFNEPMSIFWTKKFTGIELSKEYFQMFGRLPSVMKCGKNLDQDFLKGILTNDINKIGQHLRINLNKLINWRYNFRNIFDFFTYLHGEYLKTNEDKVWANNLHLFQLIFTDYYEQGNGVSELKDDIKVTRVRKLKREVPIKEENDSDEEHIKDEDWDEESETDPDLETQSQLDFNLEKSSIKDPMKLNDDGWNKLDFLDPLWKEIQSYTPRRIQHIYEEIALDDQFTFITDQKGFPSDLSNEENFNAFIKCVEMGVAQQVKDLDLKDQLFKEICVIDTNINDRLRMWFSPPIKDLALDALDSSNKLLFNDEHWDDKIGGLDWEVFKIFEPAMCEIYRCYKDAGIVINVYDFYCVYKDSVVDRMKMIDLIIEKVEEDCQDFEEEDYQELSDTLSKIKYDLQRGQSEEWDKMMLAWFLKGFQELEILGLIKQNRGKTLSIEKLAWKGV